MHPNVEAHLRRAGIPFTVRRHADCAFPINSPQDFARALGYPIERITKSLCLVATTGEPAVAVCSIDRKVRFPAIAAACASSRMRLASREELDRITGYPPNGVSPLGVACAVLVDEAVMSLATILVGAGVAGSEIELAPQDLLAATSAKMLAFSGG